MDEFKEQEGVDSEDMEDEAGAEDELAIFTCDGVGKLADQVSQKPAVAGVDRSEAHPEEEKKSSHFKSVLKELEENVSDSEDDQAEGAMAKNDDDKAE